MSILKNETIADIMTEIVGREAAVSKMETTTPTREKSSAVGNAAAKRWREAGADKEAEIARLKAALVAANNELDLARSASRKMYKRLNSENIRNTEMDRETIQGLRAENTRLRAALKPVLDAYISQDDPSVDVYDSRLDSVFALESVREAKRIYKEGCDK